MNRKNKLRRMRHEDRKVENEFHQHLKKMRDNYVEFVEPGIYAFKDLTGHVDEKYCRSIECVKTYYGRLGAISVNYTGRQ